jgi:hypothetical protein
LHLPILTALSIGDVNVLLIIILSPVSQPVSLPSTLSCSLQDPNDDEIDNPNTAKPIFLQDQDIFGSVKVTKPMWVTHVEIYRTIGAIVDPAAIKGIQRVRPMWRIYMDNEIDRLFCKKIGIAVFGLSISSSFGS